MAKRDYYDVLGVSKTASADEIRKAHRKLVLKHHPDRNKGDKGAEDKFKEIQEAYDVISDDQKRKMYDQFGHAGVAGGASADAGPFRQGRPGGGGRGGYTEWRASPGVSVEDMDLNSMFEQFFSGQPGAGGGGFRVGGAGGGARPARAAGRAPTR